MTNATNLILCAWVCVTIGLYWRYPPRVAALGAMLGGWAILPNLAYPLAAIIAGGEEFGSIHAVCIPTAPFLNKGSMIGLGCLLGALLFDWRALRAGARLRWVDIPMIVWCFSPIVTGICNGVGIYESLVQCRHLVLAWGVPYLIGRVSFGDALALRNLARAWTIVGLAYLPLCLAEFVVGPFFYHVVHGGHAYRFSGSVRMLGNRPVVFLEHGNQLGMWMTTSALAATWLWATGDRSEWRLGPLRIPSWTGALSLVIGSFLWQSHGAIVLLLVGLVPLAVRGRPTTSTRYFAIGSVVVLSLSLLVGVAWLSFKSADPRSAVRSVFHGIGKSSFTWRFARAQENVSTILERPILGWGKADWSQQTPDRTFPDPVALSLGLLSAGMYGGLGLISLMAALLLPIALAVSRLRRADWYRIPSSYRSTAIALLAVNVLDLTMNSVFLLPCLLAAGGLNSCGIDSPPAEDGTDLGVRKYRIR